RGQRTPRCAAQPERPGIATGWRPRGRCRMIAVMPQPPRGRRGQASWTDENHLSRGKPHRREPRQAGPRRRRHPRVRRRRAVDRRGRPAARDGPGHRDGRGAGRGTRPRHRRGHRRKAVARRVRGERGRPSRRYRSANRVMTGVAPPRAAILELALGAALISTTSLFVKFAHVGPTVSAFYRMAFGGIMLLGCLFALGLWRRLRWSDIGWLTLPALAFALDLGLWHRSILYVGPGLATLLGNFQVFLMAL